MIQPILYLLRILDWNGINSHVILVVLQNDNDIECFTVSIHSFKANDLNILQWQDKERSFSNVN